MSNWLQEIKDKFYKYAPYPGVYQGMVEQYPWDAKLAMDDLIDKVERLEKENGYHMRRMKMYEKRAVHFANENDRLRKELHHLEDIELNAMEAQYRKDHGLDGYHS
jgi:hypothetical protein